MIRTAPGAWRRLASRAALALVSVMLASCGSGGVSNDNATAPGTGPVTISPDTATLFSELPTTFALSGGSGSFVVTSSDQNVVPVASNIRVNRFTVVPGDVGSDTSVTLTVRDANNATAVPATAALTVKPRTISSTITITPSSSQSAACGSAICAGGDAEVSAVLSQAGVPLAGRNVQFDVLSGDVRIITSAAGTPEVDSLSGTTTTDSSGTARIRIRVLAGAPPQTALLRITDLASGFSQTASVAISSLTNAPLSAQPNSIAFVGPNTGACATGVSADVIVTGGNPPYSISQPAGFIVNPTVVDSSGRRFTVTATGQCSTGSSIAVVDASGGSVAVTVTNAPGTFTPPPFVVAPTTVTFTDCGQSAGVVLAGGTGNFFAAGNNPPLDVEVVGPGVGNIFLPVGGLGFGGTAINPSSPTPGDITLQAAFSDGQSVAPVTVKVLAGATHC